MKLRQFAILAVWTVIVLIAVGALLFLFTFGDCFDNEACRSTINRNFVMIASTGYVVYWAGFIALIRRWNR
ncbi:hypothetical protein ACUXST_002015 [Sphingomonas sp. F9_3S_D5_B_2]